MRRRHLLVILGLGATVALVACLPSRLALPQGSEPDHYVGVERIVAVGDVHGGYDELIAVLHAARVVDDEARWTGGQAHLVQTGDVLDRGAESRKVMDLLMRLERQARQAGGRVHALLGNHEVMNLTGDLRYVSAGEYAAFATPDSAAARERVFQRLAEPQRTADQAYRTTWEAEHPLGWVEHREAFGPTGRYGRWLRQHQAAIKIDRYLFLHGGLAPALANATVKDINRRVREEIRSETPPEEGLAVGRSGPLWYRGLAQADEDDMRPHVERLLTTHDVDHIVVGHTTTPGVVLPRFGGTVLLIDVGLSNRYGAHPACLVVERGKPFALHRGRMLRLPVNGSRGLVDYLRAAAALDPVPSPLVPLIDAAGEFPLAKNATAQD